MCERHEREENHHQTHKYTIRFRTTIFPTPTSHPLDSFLVSLPSLVRQHHTTEAKMSPQRYGGEALILLIISKYIYRLFHFVSQQLAAATNFFFCLLRLRLPLPRLSVFFFSTLSHWTCLSKIVPTRHCDIDFVCGPPKEGKKYNPHKLMRELISRRSKYLYQIDPRHTQHVRVSLFLSQHTISLFFGIDKISLVLQLSER